MWKTSSRMPLWGVRPIFAWLCVAGSLLSLAGCGEPANEQSDASEKELEVMEAEVMTVTQAPWPVIVQSQGSLFPDEQTVLGAKVAGRVAEVHVDLGGEVRAGDPLVTLAPEEFDLGVAQAEAQLQQARSAVGLRSEDPVSGLDPEKSPPVRQERAMWMEAKSKLSRAEDLRDQNAISLSEYDLNLALEQVAAARYASSLNSVQEKIALIGVRQAELSLALQRQQDAIIRSPLDGLVLSRNVAPGTYVAVGTTLATVVRTDPLRFRGTVPERYAQALKTGQQVRLKIESIPTPKMATITRISPGLDASSRALLFEAEIENKSHALRTGLFAKAEVIVDPDATALVIPASAVSLFAGAEKVWKVVDGVAREQTVLTAKRQSLHDTAEADENRLILQGLAEGDIILSDASNGQVARIQEIQTKIHPVSQPAP
ncbi:Multidrug resistance protein MdtA precursor [Roseimaritima multifibrata]|uniref:Multidrug resistance protein MdtA n=1 Tax=Roseimaritima multifibrata TaxID=1930274 RepID=A0A517MCJ4_9BACT|nr:efflux RND transporter periplasmic adaptor subunit [Roseimaritima multifibrata]QDS92595.1 Multidrug resistance protein MdtA precursor [Roseimaritima multifibrata]